MSFRTIELGDREGAQNLTEPEPRRNADLRLEIADGLDGYRNKEFWPIPASKEIRIPFIRSANDAVVQNPYPNMHIRQADQLPGEAVLRRQASGESGFGLGRWRHMLRPWGQRK